MLNNAAELLSSHESSGAGAPRLSFIVAGRLLLFIPILIFLTLLRRELTTIEELDGDMREGLPYSSLPPLHKIAFLGAAPVVIQALFQRKEYLPVNLPNII